MEDNSIYGRYGFADAFNPTTAWIGPDVTGIDVGTTLLAAVNLRTGNVWRWFMLQPPRSRERWIESACARTEVAAE